MKTLSPLCAYFYPNGWWGGYARWFNPCIPDRIGRRFVTDVAMTLQRSDPSAYQRAISVLTSNCTKRVAHLKGVPPRTVVCRPNAEAAVAAKCLRLWMGK
jgi:hypothetical protein